MSFLIVMFVHVVLSGRGVPLARDSSATPGSLIDLIKNYVEPINPVQSKNRFEESANLVNKRVPEGLNKLQNRQFDGI